MGCLLSTEEDDAPAEVPFFMLDKAAFSVNTECLPHWKEELPDPRYSQALFLFRQLERHPWRRRHVRDARLVVVPALLDWLFHWGRPISCGGLTHAEHLANLTAMLASSTLGAKASLPHLVLGVSYGTRVLRLKLGRASAGASAWLFDAGRTNQRPAFGVCR